MAPHVIDESVWVKALDHKLVQSSWLLSLRVRRASKFPPGAVYVGFDT